MDASGPSKFGSRYVDYDRVAKLYGEGRALPHEVLDRWRRAVLPHLPSRRERLVIADIGAGTGVFAHAWPRWVSCEVVAVEPSWPMSLVGRGVGCWVRGVAEVLPLAAGTVDVVWMSTAFHHFGNPSAAARECRRVLGPGGVVLIRTHVVDRTDAGSLREFPGLDRALHRFHRLDQIADLFSPQGLSIAAVTEVWDGTYTYAESAAWVTRMRHADSVLTALSDEEIAAGVGALRADPHRTVAGELSLVVLKENPCAVS